MGDLIDKFATRFREFGEIHIPEMSPFYAHLSLRIADDRELLEIALASGGGQPPPNLLFASIRFLLDRGANPDLLARYPVRFDTDIDPAVFDHFREFVFDHREQVEELLFTKPVQSNVVRRSAVLLTGLMRISSEVEHRPFVNIEIGASAGLTLLWEQYSYRYGDGPVVGNVKSDVEIETELRGSNPFDYSLDMPSVIDNLGIELDPISDADGSAMDWLRALIFPEHEDNRVLFDSTTKILKNSTPRLIHGDALVILPEMLADLPTDQPANIYHSHTLNQFSPEMRKRLDLLLRDASKGRLITRLGFEATPQGYSDLRLIKYENGVQNQDVVLANCEAHGRWIDWVG
ncbi:DUF2332 domain-containing protein [Candidatus Lucifugimonas marina]|uniref:DUF2332 family protein n=1 Tax=Candidatus Lucifugimonas marina TaxID=3038979 RepID=A0AAJ6CS98_9CHLR|nr:DUF2332 family protein [SAR202 cluster bacterium JH702]MDG0868463.1 DUF2332 family protein [SAR202 cluster bacterium JH639]WFG35096.1 DUF2332 family protein [SAR202 cluster bacterium JH545]WFG39053.1 DUF2332 family protein [SAR202 cluster bacterium JH1073]